MRLCILWGFYTPTDHPVPARRLYLVSINKKEKTCHHVDFDVPADHRVRMKESKKIYKHLDLATDLKKKKKKKKKLWNTKVKVKVEVIPIIINALETVRKTLEKRLEELETRGRIKTTQTRSLLR